MAMTATAFTAVAFATAAFTTTLAATAMSAAATAVKMIEHGLYLILCCLAVLDDVSLEVETLASERMVEVNSDLIASDLEDCGDEEVAVLVLQRHLCTLEDVLAVEMSVYGEHLFVKIEHTLCHMLAESVLLVQLEVELLATCETFQLLLKGVQSCAETGDEHEGLFLRSFLYE